MNLINLLRHVSLRHLKYQKARTLMAVFGICLGVAAMVSIDIVNRSVLNSFEDSINHVTGRAALQITGADSGFPEHMLDLVQKLQGVEYALPVIETNANLAGGKERSFAILGVDSLQDHQIRSYSLTDESADIPDPLLFLAKRDSILLSKEMAVREGIKIDEQIEVQTVQGIKKFTVRGLLSPEGPAKAAGGDIAFMDIYAAQSAFGKEGKIDRIDVSFIQGERLDAMKERIQRALPEGYYVDTPAGRSRQVELLLSRFRKIIGLISSMALFVGMYLIYNAVSISVVQRRKEIGILRALGATRGQIVRMFLGEAFVVSIAASLLGIGVGLVFAKLTVGIVAQSVTDFYMKTTVSELVVSWDGLVRNVVIGTIASIAASAFPAFAGARTTPVSAIRNVPYSQDGFLLSKKIRTVSAVLVFSALALFAAYKTAGPSSVFRNSGVTFISMTLLLTGVSLVTPSFLKRFIGLFHLSLSSRLGAGGRLAGLNLQKNISRNSVAVAAVFFGVALFVHSASLIYSLNRSVLDYIEAVENCDILVSSGHPLSMGGSPSIPMPGEMLEEIEKVPGVYSADPFRKTFINYDGRRIILGAIDIVRSMEYNQYIITDGDRKDVRRLLPGQDNVMVNEGLAARYGIKHGDRIVLPTPDGPASFGVAAVVVSYVSDAGSVWMDINTYRRHWKDNLADNFAVRVKDKEKIPEVREALLDRFGKDRKLFALPAREFKHEVRKMLDRSFVVTNAVNILTLIIAGFGVIIALLASVFERTREIGILRSVGMTKGQVSGVVLIESVLLGAAGGLLGAATGAFIGWISLEGFFRLDLGASLKYYVHYYSLIQALVLSIGLSALAGLYPARRAAKTNIVEALSYE